MGKNWKQDNLGERAKQLAKERKSAGEIAELLGNGITRSSVLGYLWRQGISCQSSVAEAKRKGGKRRAASLRRTKKSSNPSVRMSPARAFIEGQHEPVQPYQRAASELEDIRNPSPDRKTLQELTDSCCRWPVGDPGEPGFHFCGRKQVPLLSYCERHAVRAFQPVPVRGQSKERQVAETEKILEPT